jgi:hypothetical protein
MIPRWVQMMFGIVTDLEQPPRPCEACGGSGWIRDTTLTPEQRYVLGSISIRELERELDRRFLIERSAA